MPNTVHIGVESVTEVIGHNPENADMSNPSGARFGEVFTASVETLEGKIFNYRYSYLDEARAIEDCIFLAQLETLKLSDNPSFYFNRIVYGSKAHQATFREAEFAMMDEDERFFHNNR